MPGHEMMKVFDCQKMPQDVRDAFFNDNQASNDTYVDHWVGEGYDEDYINDDVVDNLKKIDAWLKKNGAEDAEHVLISHWW